jgi:hypothetical protein
VHSFHTIRLGTPTLERRDISSDNRRVNSLIGESHRIHRLEFHVNKQPLATYEVRDNGGQKKVNKTKDCRNAKIKKSASK